MQHQNGPLLTDTALEQLARRWFAEVRAEHPEPHLTDLQRDAVGDLGAGALDWLFEGSDSDTAGGDSSD